MTDQASTNRGSTEPIPGDPLIADPDPLDQTSTMAPPVGAPAEPLAPVAEPLAPVAEPVVTSVETPVVTSVETPAVESAPSEEEGGGKVKAAAVVAGAAAIANKVRKEAPKVVNQLRERRVAGRCVIVTEVDGRFLAIGPYKNEDAARGDVFKVGGTPHVAELVSDTAFFAPPEPA